MSLIIITVVREGIDKFICMGHSTEEITAEQERSDDFLQECVML